MKTTQPNKIIMKALIIIGLFFTATSISHAQSIQDIRWKSEAQVREILGEPQSISEPTGTHATYTMWKYQDFTVAFANSRAFHMFKKDSLRRIELEENR